MSSKIGIIILLFIFISIAFQPTTVFLQSNGDSSIQLESSEKFLLEQKLRHVEMELAISQAKSEILRDTYSSSLERINTYLSVVLLVVAIFGLAFGIIGYQGIIGIRDKFTEELGQFREERNRLKDSTSALDKELSIKIKELDGRLNKATELFKNVSSNSEEFYKRFQLLESKDRAESFISSSEFSKATEYIDMGLGLDPKYVPLLHSKANSFLAQDQYADAVGVYSEIMDIDKNDGTSIVNTAEFLLFMKNFSAYDDHHNEYKVELDDRREGYLMMYLNSLKAFLHDDRQELERNIRTALANIDDDQSISMYWRFTELDRFLKKEPKSDLKTLLIDFIGVLRGDMMKETFYEKHPYKEFSIEKSEA